MHRRHFLKQLCIGSTTTLGVLGTQVLFAQTEAQSLAATNQADAKRLIVVLLRGAVDGLNVVVPYRESEYYAARPTIAIPQPGQSQGALDLDGQFGLHPALSTLLPLWQQKHLAFVQASGCPDPTRSHFEAQDHLETGTLNGQRTQDGWMNRLLSHLAGHNPIQAVNVGNQTPRILSGRMSVATLASGRSADRALPLDQPQIAAAFDRLYAGNDALSQAYQEGRLARTALQSDLKSGMKDNSEMLQANNGAPLPIGFAHDAQRLAQVMSRDTRVRLAFMALGGWDTHVNQGSSQGILARNLSQLGQGLVTLKNTLGSVYDDTTIVVMSEFGRTVHENGNRGTDHGHGNVIWVMGGAVRGGKVYGNWRGLRPENLYQGRDLAITTDFRDVIATILERHLALKKAQIASIFPSYQPLQQNLSLLG